MFHLVLCFFYKSLTMNIIQLSRDEKLKSSKNNLQLYITGKLIYSPCLSLQLYITGKLILAHVYHCNFTLLGIWFPAHVCHCNFSLLYSCFKAHVYHYITSHIWMLLSSHIQSFEMFTFLTIVLYVFVVGLSLRQLIIYANLSIYCHCWNRIINMHFQHLIFLQKIKLTSYSSEKALLFKLILNPFQYPNFKWKICPKM